VNGRAASKQKGDVFFTNSVMAAKEPFRKPFSDIVRSCKFSVLNKPIMRKFTLLISFIFTALIPRPRKSL
jgi:hypothetical protein